MQAHATPALPTTRLVVAIALVSAGALAYQLLLMRWLAIAHWYPFAAMIIRLALLGHGASGTWLSLQRTRAQARFHAWFPACALAFAASAVAVLPLAARIPFNGLELVWNARQLLWLGALYLLLALPFFFAAGCFGLAFAGHGERIPRLYGADLLGAGAGALLGLGLMWRPLSQALALAAACGALAALMTLPSVRSRKRWLIATSGVLAGVLLAAGSGLLEPPVNAWKGQSRTLLLPQARVITQSDSPYGRLTVVESPRVPLRHQVGLSLANTREPAPQLAVFVDGDAMWTITRAAPPDRLDYVDRTLAALPYRLVPAPRVLVMGAGGGTDLRLAKRHRARSIDLVDADARRLRWQCERLVAYAGALCDGVRTHARGPRAFVRGQPGRFDLIVLAGEESMTGSSAGVQAASEQFALTREAVGEYLHALAPGGMLVVTRLRKQPPRDELKLWATLVAGLRDRGGAAPAAHLLALRGWDASLMLATRDPLTPRQYRAARGFAAANGFELLPARAPMAAAKTGDTPDDLAAGLRALLTPQADAFVTRYRFAIAPATDDTPYFGDFFRWRSLPELWRLREAGGAVLLDSGYLLLCAALVQAVLLALALVLLPLRLRDLASARAGLPRWRVAMYFIGLGLAFLVIEIACLSRLALLVGHGLVATAVGLGGFLVFAGLGSLAAPRAGTPARAVAAIALGVLWHVATAALVALVAPASPLGLRAAAALVSIAPLAFAMGMPFPLGLARLARQAPALVPWAWALNGFASVVAAIAALLLAMAVGLQATLGFALALYLVAAWVWPASDDAPPPAPRSADRSAGADE
ncbi:polyamine aminopropyltransferase [Agrilutibacter solisilvae]|uniref:Class I SAM-dependent methyltransferase n=1 Tax=Agrilutibacter solisilvae TaxID=2763317 RepID=A0A975AT23_9GAMM|nr:class I SAM-dependent methyltransferase [Lysobacter solisilvae]QSX79357.1 class I SAM-dependent methyltransferase [Lysobacter solisilvae]